ncbi:chaperonin 10-like protein [Roridomyces roridus]|uniref:Chaperonin 10-like protein n=1 Tax=Roridomyces roridus TaxID=1738132 RepID=A0AAD7FES6_9AGAR|nr:chaperonin 10-like protein [Roridomyces roridus]
MKAVVTLGDGKCQIRDVPLPALEPGYLLVKVIVAAQNPTDWKMLLQNKQPGNIIGCDFAGVVANVGDCDSWSVGDRVAGCIHGGIGPNGAFAEYLSADSSLLFALPPQVSFEHGAQLGIACVTACQSLYQTLRLPPPFNPAATPEDILIWSGTSAMGQYLIQFAKLSGFRVISTASLNNIQFVKDLGADLVFDYADSLTCKRIVKATRNSLRYAVDCISEGTTRAQTSWSLGANGGTIATLLPYKCRLPRVDTEFVLAYSYLGKPVKFPFEFPANAEHYENGRSYCRLVSHLLAKDLLKPVPIRLYPDGLASVHQGLEDMQNGKIHAEKITYRITDTPD